MIKTALIGLGIFVGILVAIYVLARCGWPVVTWFASLGW
mgnify:CR=1 FL=1